MIIIITKPVNQELTGFSFYDGLNNNPMLKNNFSLLLFTHEVSKMIGPKKVLYEMVAPLDSNMLVAS